ncbi:MAG: vitamin K epoxide reductase, partial [Bacteroidales bacterium]|nr:vitamin K epoxide reductase [Bacteroidales bacterium]
QWALLGMALFGVGFSIYLTCLELFTIHAVCTWCLTSAVIMAALLALSVDLGGEVLARGRR